MIDLPNSIDAWLKFMNGYRDPKTLAEMREAKHWEDDFFDMAGGGPNSGSGSRECGDRKEGGVYATCPLSTSGYGMPLEHFIPCYPVKIVAEDYNLANVGVKLVDIEETCEICKGIPYGKKKGAKYEDTCLACFGSGTETVTHIFDIVGQEYYPNVADFLEEARRMGVSRRLELEDKKQYARLSKRSRLMLLHHKAVILNPAPLHAAMDEVEVARLERAGCPGGREHTKAAIKNNVGCSALHWNTVNKGLSVGGDAESRFVNRTLKSGTYRGYAPPPAVEINYHLGIFGVFPLAKIQVVDPSGEYENKLQRAETARLDVEKVTC